MGCSPQETVWILKLTKPVCVNGKQEYDLDFVPEANVKAVQLIVYGDSGGYMKGTILYQCRICGHDDIPISTYVESERLLEIKTDAWKNVHRTSLNGVVRFAQAISLWRKKARIQMERPE